MQTSPTLLHKSRSEIKEVLSSIEPFRMLDIVDGDDIYIPAVFVGYTDGKALGLDYCYNCSALEKQQGR